MGELSRCLCQGAPSHTLCVTPLDHFTISPPSLLTHISAPYTWRSMSAWPCYWRRGEEQPGSHPFRQPDALPATSPSPRRWLESYICPACQLVYDALGLPSCSTLGRPAGPNKKGALPVRCIPFVAPATNNCGHFAQARFDQTPPPPRLRPAPGKKRPCPRPMRSVRCVRFFKFYRAPRVRSASAFIFPGGAANHSHVLQHLPVHIAHDREQRQRHVLADVVEDAEIVENTQRGEQATTRT
eukprot:gene11465-biopygen22890